MRAFNSCWNANINAIDHDRYTPIHYGAASGFFEEYTEQIKKHDTDTQIPDSANLTLLDYQNLLGIRFGFAGKDNLVKHLDPTLYVPGAARQKREDEQMNEISDEASQQFYDEMAEIAHEQGVSWEVFLDSWTD